MAKNCKRQTDEELDRLALLAKSKKKSISEPAFASLWEHYYPLMTKQANSRYPRDFDSAFSAQQEGLLAAVRDWQPKRGLFGPFACLCIKRRLQTLLQLSVDRITSGSREVIFSLSDVGKSKGVQVGPIGNMFHKNKRLPAPQDALLLVERKEAYFHLLAEIRERLSPLEWKVFRFSLLGKTYAQMQEESGLGFKSIDNALRRVQAKFDRKDLQSFLQVFYGGAAKESLWPHKSPRKKSQPQSG